MVRGRRGTAALAAAIAIASLSIGGDAATATESADANADDARRERVASSSLFSDARINLMFSQFLLGTPTRAEATFTAPTAPGCEKFGAAIDTANKKAIVKGARWSSGDNDVVQSSWSLPTEKEVREFVQQVLDADIVACSKATAPADGTLVIKVLSASERKSSDDDVFLATLAQLDAPAPAGGTATTDFVTFWVVGDRIVTRFAGRFNDVDVVSSDATFTASYGEEYTRIIGQFTDEFRAAQSPYLGITPPRSPEPWAAGSLCDGRVNGLVYDTLLTQKANGATASGLADSWSVSDDGRSLTLKLKPIKWSDGDLVTAADVVYSLQQTSANPGLAPTLGSVTTIEAIDDRTVKLTLSDNTAATSLWGLTGAAGSVAKPGSPYPASAGLYAWELISPEEAIAIFSQRGPSPDALTFVPVVTAGGLAALQSGAADIVSIGPEQIAPAKQAGLRVSSHATGSGPAVYFNYIDHPLFADPNVRQAIAYAIDRDEILDAAAGGRGLISDQPAGPGWGYEPTVTYEYDPEKAQQLLDNAGWPATTPVDVVVFEGTAGASTSQIVTNLQDNFGTALGRPVTVRSVNSAELTSAIADRSAELIVTAQLQQPFPANTLAQAIAPGFGLAQSTGAATVFAGSELLTLLQEAQGTTPAERRKIYEEAVKALNAEVPYVQLYFSPVTVAWDPQAISGTPLPGLGPCDAWELKGVSSR